VDQTWEKVVRDRIIPKKWGVVVPGKVYRSGQISKELIESVLTKNGIRAIINLQSADPDDANQEAERSVATAHGIAQYRFPLGGDGTGQIGNYADAIANLTRLEAEGTPVLVHCAAGAQRTGGVVAAYRVLVRQESPQLAYAEMRSYAWKPGRD